MSDLAFQTIVKNHECFSVDSGYKMKQKSQQVNKPSSREMHNSSRTGPKKPAPSHSTYFAQQPSHDPRNLFLK